MSRPSLKPNATPREKLVYFVRELEARQEAKTAAAAAERDEFKRASMHGLDVSTLRVILKLIKLTPEQRKTRRGLEMVYLAELGILDGDALPESVRRRLAENAKPKPKKGKDDPNAPSTSGGDAVAGEPGTSPEPDSPPAPTPAQAQLPLKDPAEAHQEGLEAGDAGKSVYDNPYPAGDPCRGAWDEGWCQSRGSGGMDIPEALKPQKPKPNDDQPGDKSGKGKAA